MNKIVVFLWVFFLGVVLSANPPSTGAFYSGVYRNLFSEIGKSDTDIQNKLNSAWNQLFNGNSDQQVYYSVGSNMAYIKDVANNDVRSEGMSYGMMIAVQMNKQAEFDKLYRWAVTYMRHNDANDARYGYFAWQCSTSGSIMDQNSASDGETYIATALLFARGRWGNSTSYNYDREFQNLLYVMIHKEDGGTKNGVTNMFNTQNYQVVFTPYSGAAAYTDPSYHTPGFYQLWALYVNSSNAFWNSTVSAARDYFVKSANSQTGLTPNYSNFDGSPYGSGSSRTFSYDAWRSIQNIAVDYAWFAADSREIKICDALLTFFNNQGITKYGNEFELSGSVISSTHSPGLVAMNAVAALGSSVNIANDFVNQLWQLSIPSGQYRYYDGVLYFLGLLHASGNFRIYH